MEMKSLALLLLAASGLSAQSLAGLWDATVTVSGREIPFRMEIAGAAPAVRGWFFNGDEKVVSTSGRFENNHLLLLFDFYAGRLEANFQDGALTGTYSRPSGTYTFHARRFTPASTDAADIPSIAGLWEMQANSTRGEAAWRLIIRQSGPEVSAAILRIDGDTGELSGRWRDGKFVLSHFSGARPAMFEVTPRPDGTLTIVEGDATMIAHRSKEARAKGLPEPTDPSRHTSMKDPTEPFRFSFPDLSGRTVSNTDARFRNKVLIVTIGGSWCPNCHDEAPFLMELYRKYRSRGLEIVALSFEDGDQLTNPRRLRAFLKKYRIEYPTLLAGETEQLNERIPQAANLNSWPTSFFLGRDGRVRSVHAGFAGKAAGEFHTQLKEEVIALVEKLLNER